jgi:pimeloyl-ACP methyl ester carboxylesterase
VRSQPTLVLFTGLAADERLLEPQRSLPYELVVPPWIEPREGESLPQFARRMAESVRWPQRFVVGGVSFGGMIAAEIASDLKPNGVLLIASCLSSRSIPSMYRFINALCKAVPDPALRFGATFSRPFLNIFRSLSDDDQRVMADMLHKTPLPRLRRLAQMVLTWEGTAELPCPRMWIHGEGDLVIPLRKVRPDVVIPAAGHLVNWTHREEVNAIIRRFVESLTA